VESRCDGGKDCDKRNPDGPNVPFFYMIQKVIPPTIVSLRMRSPPQAAQPHFHRHWKSSEVYHRLLNQAERGGQKSSGKFYGG
jgi:hypothetical protein